jgi:hypothetical protein
MDQHQHQQLPMFTYYFISHMAAPLVQVRHRSCFLPIYPFLHSIIRVSAFVHVFNIPFGYMPAKWHVKPYTNEAFGSLVHVENIYGAGTICRYVIHKQKDSLSHIFVIYRHVVCLCDIDTVSASSTVFFTRVHTHTRKSGA